MLNGKSVNDVNQSTFSKEFRWPLYDSYCFSNIPGTIEKLLIGHSNLTQLPNDVTPSQKYDKVILFFIDAFGWRFYERYKDRYPALQMFLEKGIVSKITSQFPSTTAAHVTTIHTAKRVDDSGVFEWFYFEPKVDAMIAPLLFSYAGDSKPNTLKGVIEPSELYPNDTFYHKLEEQGINTYLFQSRDYTPSTYGNVTTDGVRNTNAFGDMKTALSDLSKAVISESGKAYFFFYYSKIDDAGHKFGTSSDEFEVEVEKFFIHLENLFLKQVLGNCGKTLMLLTADHGQTDTDPDTTIYLNIALPEIKEWTKTNQAGDLLVVGGSPRDMFLYIKDEYIQLALEHLRTLLNGKAEIHLTSDLMEQGLFGTNPSKTLKSRMGNICILPYANNSVYWWEEGRFEQDFYGNHGGLAPEEMDSLLLALEL